MFGSVTTGEFRAAQILTGATMAAWLASGWMPALQPYATKIRVVVLTAYLLCCAGFIVYLVAR